MSTDRELTQEILKSLLTYNPDTGLFFWKRKLRNSNTTKPAGSATEKNYIKISVFNKKYFAHRLAWLYVYGEWPPVFIDHINHNTLDNRICNLRSVSKQENSKNRFIPSNNKSGHMGVIWHKDTNKWCAQIVISKKHIHLGLFADINNAIKVRKEAELRYKFHQNHGMRP